MDISTSAVFFPDRSGAILTMVAERAVNAISNDVELKVLESEFDYIKVSIGQTIVSDYKSKSNYRIFDFYGIRMNKLAKRDALFVDMVFDNHDLVGWADDTLVKRGFEMVLNGLRVAFEWAEKRKYQGEWGEAIRRVDHFGPGRYADVIEDCLAASQGVHRTYKNDSAPTRYIFEDLIQFFTQARGDYF